MILRMGFQRVVLMIAAFAGSIYAAILLFGQINTRNVPDPITFPIAISEDLTVHCLTGYDGPYLEDGSMEEVVNIAALVLENRGPRHIQNVTIYLSGARDQLVFTACHIPPNSKLLVLEANKKIYSGETLFEIKHRDITCSYDLLQSSVAVREQEKGVFISNLTNRPLKDIVLYYKQYDAASQMYIGGIARSCPITVLAPMGSVTVFPLGFLLPYCKVVAVEQEIP